MRLPVATLLLAGALVAPFVACAQEVAGRLVVVAGDVTLIRGDQKIVAQRGTEVRSGDTLQLGTESNAQLLLSDESIIALRPETVFRLSEYAFQAKDPDSGRAVFSLLKGGLRTVTGFIGRRNRSNYSVGTPVATIGIRGTHYNLVHCDNSCRNPNGSLAPNGTYGGITDGRIGVANKAGDREFGRDQYFHVVSLTAAPQSLLVPPVFLTDKVAGRASTGSKQVAPTAGGAQQTRTTTATTGDVAVSAGTSLVLPVGGGTSTQSKSQSLSLASALPVPVSTVGNNADNSTSLPTLIQPSFSGTVFLPHRRQFEHRTNLVWKSAVQDFYVRRDYAGN